MALPKSYKINKQTLSKLKEIPPTKKFSGRNFYIKYYKDDGSAKLASILLKKHLNKASQRNLVRRRLHYFLLTHLEKFLPGYYIIISRDTINKNISYEEISTEINNFLSKVF